MYRKFILILLITVNATLWCQSWSVAPSTASGSPDTARSASFRSIEGRKNLNGWLIDDEGWYWLRIDMSLEDSPEGILFDGTELGWTAWWNGEYIDDSGSGPPFWSPSVPIPDIADISASSGLSGELLLKSYIRKGFTDPPAIPITGKMGNLRIKQVYRTLFNVGIPAFVFISGLILFVGSLAGALARRESWDICLSLFGLFMAVSATGAALVVIPNIGGILPWLIPALAARLAIPFAVSFWRRSTSVAGKKDILAVSLTDYVLTAYIAVWELASILPHPDLPVFFNAILAFDPLPWFLVYSALIGLIQWLVKSIQGRPNRWGSLLIWLTAVAVPAGSFGLGNDLAGLPEVFLTMGLPLSLATALIVAISRRPQVISISDDTADNLTIGIGEPFDEEPEELEMLDDFVEQNIETMSPSPVKTPLVKSHDDVFIRSLRSNLYPEAIPWDANWDLASARQGTAHPSTGFHDVYTGSDGRLSGFSFMDAGSSDLESMIFAHMTRSEMLRIHKPGTPLPRIARTVHRKVSASAGAAGKAMTGVIGRFRDESVGFIPLSLPPLLLKRAATGKIVSLQPFEGRAANPPLGSKRFGEAGLRTVNVAMSSGDVMVSYTPSLVDDVGQSGQTWGVAGLAKALKVSRGTKAEEIVADIINAFKDYISKDTVDSPLQILVIKKR